MKEIKAITQLSMALFMALTGNVVQSYAADAQATGGLPAHTESDAVGDTSEVETEFYVGQKGYRHSGISLSSPLGKKQRIGLTVHTVREAAGEA